MSLLTALTVGGSLLGGLLGRDASRDAADASRDGALAGVAENGRQFDAVLDLQQPAIDSRDAALAALNPLLYGDGPEATEALRNTPGYGFMQSEGERGVLAARNAAGDIFGGGTALELQRQRMGMADQTYNNRIAQLLAASGQGAAGANAVSGAALSTGANNAQLLQNAGNARASGIMGGANSIGGAVNQLALLYGSGAFGNNGDFRTPGFGG